MALSFVFFFSFFLLWMTSSSGAALPSSSVTLGHRPWRGRRLPGSCFITSFIALNHLGTLVVPLPILGPVDSQLLFPVIFSVRELCFLT